MEPLNDNELRDLLRQWEAPAAPVHLEHRIFGAPTTPWRWLLTGSIRVPVPAFVLLLLVFSALTYVLHRSRQITSAPVQEVRLSDFQPVAELKPRVIKRAYEAN
jgi:hypothetical protein